MGESAEPNGTGKATERRRSGPVRAQVDRIIRDRTGTRTTRAALAALPIERTVDALLAQAYADAVDRASTTGNDVRLVAVAEKLRDVLASLEGAAAPDELDDGSGRGTDDGARSGGQLHDILERGPAMGYAADA